MNTKLFGVFFGLLVIVLVVLAGFFFKSCTIIESGHVGVVSRMGEIQPELLHPGFSLVNPFTSTVESVDTRQQRQGGTQPCFTSDLQNATITYQVAYSLPADKVITTRLTFNGNLYTDLIQPKMNEVFEEIAPGYAVDKIVQSRAEIKVKALEKLRHSVGSLCQIDDIAIPNIDLSDEVEKAIEQKMVKQQHAEAKKFEQESAVADAAITRTKADGEAYAIKTVSEALQQSPNMVALEAVKKWSGNGLQTLVLGGNATPVIPIPPSSSSSDYKRH